MKIGGYARVSTDKTDQLNSLENQKYYFNTEIQSKGHELVNIYFDEGMTGTKLNNRDGFIKMLYDAGIDIKEVNYDKYKRKSKTKYIYITSEREPLFDEIWIKNTSRFARNTLSFEIIQALREKHVNIYFIEQSINTKEISQDFMLKLFQLFDEQDSKDKSIKVKTGIKSGIKRGIIHTSGKLYGYNYIVLENRLEIVPEEAEIIKKIFELYSNNHGIRKILQYLSSNNIHTRKGKDFVNNTIRNILSNEKYAGLNNRGKYDTGIVLMKNSYPKVKNEYDIQDTGKIPPIIDKELFFKCRDILYSKINYINQKGLNKGISEYAGLIYCDKCGSLYYSNRDRDKRTTGKDLHFYNCSLKKKKGKTACDNPNVPVNLIEEEISKLCNGKYKDSYIIPIKAFSSFALSQYKEKMYLRINNETKEIVDSKNRTLDSKRQGLNRLTDLYLNLEIEKEDYINRSNIFKNEIEVLENEIKSIGKSNDEIFEDIQKIEQAISNIESLEVKEKYTKEELLKEVVKIKVQSKDNSINLFFVFKWMNEYAKIIKKYELSDIQYSNIINNA